MSYASLNEGYQKLCESAQRAYPKASRSILEIHALRLQDACVEVRDLIGAKVLDLGCGSKESLDLERDWASEFLALLFPARYQTALQYFQPWYLRLASLARAETIGIDLAPNKGEPFRALQKDLTNPDDALGDLPEETFRIVNNKLFTASSREMGNVSGPASFSPTLMRAFGRNFEAVYELDRRIRGHVQRLLATGGIYTHGDLIYRKEAYGNLVLADQISL